MIHCFNLMIIIPKMDVVMWGSLCQFNYIVILNTVSHLSSQVHLYYLYTLPPITTHCRQRKDQAVFLISENHIFSCEVK